jgi:hypothetical protein
MLGLLWVRRKRRRAFREAMAHVVQQLSGRLTTTVSGLAAWLNRYWAGPYEGTAMLRGIYFLVAVLNTRGFPTLIHLDPYRTIWGSQYARGAGHQARLQVLVAAWDAPGAQPSADPQQVADLRARLQQLGYSVSESPAGLLAAADAATLQAARRNPATLHELALVTTNLTYLAEALGRAPATAMP